MFVISYPREAQNPIEMIELHYSQNTFIPLHAAPRELIKWNHVLEHTV